MAELQKHGFLRAFLALSGGFIIALVLAELMVRFFVPVRNVGPSFTVYDPEYGKVLKPNFSATRITPEFSMSISTNAAGFRGDDFDAQPHAPILFLGDSFTLGYGVNDGEEFPALIERRLRQEFGQTDASVINAGIGDTGNGRWVKFLRDEADRYRPSLVVLQFMSNDFSDNNHEGLFRLDQSGELQELSPQRSKARLVQAGIELVPGLSYSYLVGLMRQIRSIRLLPTSADSPPPPPPSLAELEAKEALTWRLIDSSLAICRERGYPLSESSWDSKAASWNVCRRCLAPTKCLTCPCRAKRCARICIMRWTDTGTLPDTLL